VLVEVALENSGHGANLRQGRGPHKRAPSGCRVEASMTRFLRRGHHKLALSSQMVTGPSLTRWSAICALKRPVATVRPASRRRVQKWSRGGARGRAGRRG
jgi:hypothetical protein